jgi:hypothetical protein
MCRKYVVNKNKSEDIKYEKTKREYGRKNNS